MQIGEDSFLGEFSPAAASFERCVGRESDFASVQQLRRLGRQQLLQRLEIGRMQPDLHRSGCRQSLHGLLHHLPHAELAGFDHPVDEPRGDRYRQLNGRLLQFAQRQPPPFFESNDRL